MTLKRRKYIGFILVVVLLSGFCVVQIQHQRQKHSLGMEATSVDVVAVRQQDVAVTVEVIGSIQAHATVNVKSLVDGQLLSIGFNKGDFVKVGQVLFVIDQRPFQIALEQAQADLARDQAQLLVAAASLKRNKQLMAQHFISMQDLDQLQGNYDALVATIESDRAKVNNAALQLSYCTITAPIDGRVGDTLVNVGNLVKASDQSSLVVINQITPVDVKFSIAEKQLGILRSNTNLNNVTIYAKLDANPDVIKEGKISFLDNAVDTQTGMIQLQATFANVDRYFWPGQFVHVTLPLTHVKQALLVPTRVLQVGQHGTYVFVVEKNKTSTIVKVRDVKVGAAVGDMSIVESGLQKGEQVVNEGQLSLTDGMRVHVQPIHGGIN